MSEEKYWLYLWSIIAITILILSSIVVYSGYLDDERDLEMASKGLQFYRVERCVDLRLVVEWHEAGWVENEKY